ncbi:MAG: hypothetical protein WC756_22125 [Taibaiella sp.]|jgi:hypothetical protein
MNRKIAHSLVILSALTLSFTSCKKKDDQKMLTPRNPDTAETPVIDRFSAAAGHLQLRTATNGLPEANQPVNFDQGPFITTGLTAAGMSVEYYNFDIQPTTPAPIYVLFRSGQPDAVSGQLNIINVIPGDAGYNDFWQVYKVTVPADYVANTITSYSDLIAAGYTIEKTSAIVNCPVVPKGSNASKRYTNEDAGLTRGWYKDKVVFYFNFSEKALATNSSGMVPVVPIFVTFNINPGQPNGGPASGFKTEPGTNQTHNVIATVPSDSGYSPLWSVSVYDNSAFNSVYNLASATAAPILASGIANVNCPVVRIQ